MNQIVPFAAAPSFDMADIKEIALAIANGGLFGSRDPAAVLTLCLLAHAEGQHPAVVFRDYHIIQGKPAKKADAMLRDFVTAGGRVEWHRLDDTVADATFTHPGGGSARIDWTMERARNAGLSTPMWKKYPRQMLRSRVISEGVRTVYPGATSGLYEVGEVQDISGTTVDTPAQEVAPEPLAIEHQPEPEEAPRRERVKLDGPYTSKTALWSAVRAFDREVRSCGDVDQLEALLATDDSKALIKQLYRDTPFLMDGGEGQPAEFEPLAPLIERLRCDLINAANEGWREDVTRAG